MDTLDDYLMLFRGHDGYKGPCWRCQMLNRKCDKMIPCLRCPTRTGRLWQLGCHRGNLRDHLPAELGRGMALSGLASGVWCLPSLEFVWYKIVKQPPSKPITEAELPSNYSEPPNLPNGFIIPEYLKDILRMDPEYIGVFELHTEQIIRQSIQYQVDILAEAAEFPTGYESDILLVATALRCLRLSHEIGSLGAATCGSAKNYTYPGKVETDSGNGQQPTYDVTVQQSSKLGEQEIEPAAVPLQDNLLLIIKSVVHRTQQLLFRRRPQDWPKLIYTLCLLTLVSQNVQPGVAWMSGLYPLSERFTMTLSILCDLFHVRTKGCHPLRRDWDGEEYKKLNGVDQIAHRHMEFLHIHWLVGSFVEDEPDTDRTPVYAAGDFREVLDRFAFDDHEQQSDY